VTNIIYAIHSLSMLNSAPMAFPDEGAGLYYNSFSILIQAYDIIHDNKI